MSLLHITRVRWIQQCIYVICAVPSTQNKMSKCELIFNEILFLCCHKQLLSQRNWRKYKTKQSPLYRLNRRIIIIISRSEAIGNAWRWCNGIWCTTICVRILCLDFRITCWPLCIIVECLWFGKRLFFLCVFFLKNSCSFVQIDWAHSFQCMCTHVWVWFVHKKSNQFYRWVDNHTCRISKIGAAITWRKKKPTTKRKETYNGDLVEIYQE